MTLRKQFVKTIEKFIRDNSLLPPEYFREQFKLMNNENNNSIIFRAHKTKYYGVLFGIKNKIEYDFCGIIKIYSPRFIQIWSYEKNIKAPTYYNFNGLIDALTYFYKQFLNREL